MSEYSNGRFRQKRVNFSMISNEILHDNTVSLKAKGLYCIIQSYVTIPNFVLYKSHLLKNCKEGSKAFETAWKELKDAGYLIQYRIRDKKGQFIYEYDLLDVAKKPYPQNRCMAISSVSHTPKNGGMDCPATDFPNGENRGYINNTNLNNTNPNNININHINRADLIEQIGYNENTIDDFVENIISLMLDVFNTPDDALIRINQSNQPARIVKERFRQIRYKHIEYIRLVFSELSVEISSFKNYMVTTLFNSVATCDLYFNQRVNRDLYGEGAKEWQQAK